MKKNFKIFLKGKFVDFVIIDENFVRNTDWFDWINQSINTEFLTVGNYPNTKSHQKKYFLEQIVSNKRVQFGVYSKLHKKLAGVISLYSINLVNRDAFISTFFNKKKNFNSLNIFLETHEMIINYGFKKMNLRRITSTTISKEMDDLVCKLLKFKKEGIMKKKVFKNNKYHNLYISSILK
jgi:RimJ/RimL family protein N-acetyltransferase